MNLPIEIWSDIACPWCLVGKRRLESALSQLRDDGESAQFDITFRSFELDPRKKDPQDQTPYVERLASKYRIPPAQAQGMIDNMSRTGLEEGIAFDFEHAVPANTFDAHRLLHWARAMDDAAEKNGRQPSQAQARLKEAFMAAHFEQGVDLGSHAGLLSVVDSIGLDVDDASSVLSSDTHGSDVREDEEEAQMLGITGVPFFVIGRFGVSGAQRPDTLVEVIRRALSEQAAAQRDEREAAAALDAAEGEMCTPETC